MQICTAYISVVLGPLKLLSSYFQNRFEDKSNLLCIFHSLSLSRGGSEETDKELVL